MGDKLIELIEILKPPLRIIGLFPFSNAKKAAINRSLGRLNGFPLIPKLLLDQVDLSPAFLPRNSNAETLREKVGLNCDEANT